MSYARAMGTAPMTATTTVGGSSPATNPTGAQWAPQLAPPPPPSMCPPGYALGPTVPGGPRHCVPSTYPVGPTIAPQPPVSDWRRQIADMLMNAGRIVFTLPGEILAQLMALVTGTPAVQQEGEGFSRALNDPNQSDAQVADKLRVLNDRYRSMKPSMPAPAVRIFDPIMDGAINLVPANIRPPTLLPSTALAPSPLDSVPWLWAAGSFVAGMLACSFLGGPKKTTPNRRRRRRR